MMTRLALFCALIVCGFSFGSAFALEVVFPQNGRSFTRPLLIVTTENPQVTAYKLAIDGVWSDPIDISDPQYAEYFKKFLILPLPFAGGKNRLEVQSLANGRILETAAAEVWYLDEPFATAPEGWVPDILHTPEREAKCVGCHEMNPDAVQLGMKTVDANPCGSCHRGMLEEPFVHGPTGTMDCLFCHDSSANGRKYVVGTSGAGLCTQCHDDKDASIKQDPFVHGPVAAGECTICHSPHSTEHKAQLAYKVNDLCLQCHVDVTKDIHVVRAVGGNSHPLEGPKNPADKTRPFNCASCHDPHTGKSSTYFRYGIEKRFALCMKCHQK